MQVLNYSEFRKNLKVVLDKIVDDQETTIVTRSHDKDVVLVSLHEYNSWMETMHLMRSDRNRSRLADSMRNIENGNFETRSLIDD